MIDLVFVSAFIGVNGVTVMGFVAPLFMFIELVGTMIGNGARNKVSAMIGAGKLEESNRIFSDSLILTGGLTIVIGLLVGILFHSSLELPILWARHSLIRCCLCLVISV